jgi:hypothetical protein
MMAAVVDAPAASRLRPIAAVVDAPVASVAENRASHCVAPVTYSVTSMMPIMPAHS